MEMQLDAVKMAPVVPSHRSPCVCVCIVHIYTRNSNSTTSPRTHEWEVNWLNFIYGTRLENKLLYAAKCILFSFIICVDIIELEMNIQYCYVYKTISNKDNIENYMKNMNHAKIN